MHYVYEGKYEKRICSICSTQFIPYGAAANENIAANITSTPPLAHSLIANLFLNFYNQPSASKASGKTTARPMNDPDSPNYSSKSLQILNVRKSEINVYETLARKCKLCYLKWLHYILFFVDSWRSTAKVWLHTYRKEAVPGPNILMVTKFS